MTQSKDWHVADQNMPAAEDKQAGPSSSTANAHTNGAASSSLKVSEADQQQLFDDSDDEDDLDEDDDDDDGDLSDSELDQIEASLKDSKVH